MKIIGIMTGNSLDGCDIVLTEFTEEKMNDIAFFSKKITKLLQKNILKLKKKIKNRVLLTENLMNDSFFIKVHNDYIHWIKSAIQEFLSQERLSPRDIDLIGFHGQTLDHNPPSVASKDFPAYTLQMGSGQMLADLVGVPVVYDFRSDDIFLNGEGAPLIPPHNEHVAKQMGLKNAVFYNAGNTSNLALILDGKVVLGFDAGPFNEFSDKLVRQYKDIPFDKDGFWGLKGELNLSLLEKLFYQSVKTKENKKYLELSAPKSADPSLYHIDDLLVVKDEKSFVDTLFTLSYFSGYVAAYALKHIQKRDYLPNVFVLFGGGWKNPIAFDAFSNILKGTAVVLKEHEKVFAEIKNQFQSDVQFVFPEGGTYMEARLMADLAYHFEKQIPWGDCTITGRSADVVLGVKSMPATVQSSYEDMVNRACEGWQKVRVKSQQ